MEENYLEADYISISDILYSLKKKWRIIAIVTLVFALAAGVYFYFLSEPLYEGSVKIFASNDEKVQSEYVDKEMESYYNMMGTYIEIIKTEDFMNTIIDETGVETTAQGLIGKLEFITTENTPILQIKYSSTNEEMAKEVVSVITKEFEAQVTEVVLNTYTKVIDSVKVKEVTPNKPQMIVIATLLGVLVGCGLAIFMDKLDDTIVRIEDLEKVSIVPILGELPLEEIDGIKKSKRKGKDKKKKASKNDSFQEGANVYS